MEYMPIHALTTSVALDIPHEKDMGTVTRPNLLCSYIRDGGLLIFISSQNIRRGHAEDKFVDNFSEP
jgi:hypothetical protein